MGQPTRYAYVRHSCYEPFNVHQIFDVTITVFAALAARDPRILTDVAHQKEFISTLVEIFSSLDFRKDVLALFLTGSSDNDLKPHGIQRSEITAVSSLLG